LDRLSAALDLQHARAPSDGVELDAVRGVEPQRPVAACGEPGGQVAAGFQQRQDVFQRIHRAPLARLRKWTMTKAFRTLAHRSSSPVILAWPVSRRPRREHDMAADDTRRTTTPFTRDATAEE